MTKTKRVIRVIILTILIILACAGMGFMIPLNKREQMMDNEILMELVEKKRDEEESESEKKN